MRISLLLQREPFGEILEKTLARFWNARYGQDFQVRWQPNRPNLRSIRKRGEQAWLGNIYLNAIFAPHVDPAAFDPIKQEFARSLVPWKRPFQSAYVSVATNQFGAPWLSQVGLAVYPPVPDADTQLVIGGNHKIRILDHREGLAYSILKDGFDPSFMKQELETRRLAEGCGIPVPPIKEVGEDGSWFSERYISGTPINRLADQEKAKRIAESASKSLQKLTEKTIREESLMDYVNNLHDRIESLLQQNRLLTDEQKRSLQKNMDVILQQINTVRPVLDDKIMIAMTHGDFQPANILVDGDDFWLIDWEYADRRQIQFDALVFSLNARLPDGLSYRLRQFSGQILDKKYVLCSENLLNLEWVDEEERRLLTLIYVLEEMTLRLKESANNSFRQITEGLKIFMSEIGQWLTQK